MRPGCILPITLAASLAACGTGATGTTASLTADPSHYLLSIDQLATPDFTVSTPAHALDASALAGGDPRQAQLLATAGLAAAAGVEYFRAADLATANGPLDIADTAARFATQTGAGSVFTGDARRLDAAAGAVPISTGSLGDQAHAVSTVRTAPDNTQAVQITLEWRVANVINVLVLRGRYGGTRLDDALTLAQRVTPGEQVTASG